MKDSSLNFELSAIIMDFKQTVPLVNLCVSLVLFTASIMYLQLKATWIEESFAALQSDVSIYCTHRVKRTSQQYQHPVAQQLVANNTEEDLQVVQLQGGIPLQHIKKNGRIGPWVLSEFGSDIIELVGGSTEAKIKSSGLYFIYAQISYVTSGTSNSFEVRMSRREQHRTLTTCSSQATEAVSEVSCFTGIAYLLRVNDRLYLNQVEQDRYINFNNGFSHLGIVKMNKKEFD